MSLWKKLLTKTVVWLAAEIILNFLGLDNLADYSEFIFDKHIAVYYTIFFSREKF